MGADFSVADAYLFTVTTWARHVGVDVSGFKHLDAFMARMRERPGVKAALKAENPNAA